MPSNLLARKRPGSGFGCTLLVLLWILLAAKAASPTSLPTDPKIAPPTLAGDSFLTIPGEQWKLLWHDEFTGDRLDTTKWTSGLSWLGDDGTYRHHNYLYASYIMDDDAVLKDGILQLLTNKTDVADPSGRVFHYTQAFIQTQGKFDYMYGYCEIRAKVPIEAGKGLWPAFWMLSRGWPPEDDIAEFWTGRPLPHFHQGFAFRQLDGKVVWISRHVDRVPTGFHTYGMEWGPGYQLMNFDGRVRVRVYGPQAPNVPMYLILNSGVTTRPSPPAGDVFPNAFVVDYVRVYKRPSVVPLHNGGFEDNSLTPWKAWNHASIVTDHAHTGQCALRLNGSPSSVEQQIYGLRPNAVYQLSGWADAGPDKEVRLGVKDYGGPEVFGSRLAGGYQRVAVDFTTGPRSRTATIYCFKPTGSGASYFDDIAISDLPSPQSPP
jgi:beta-glucanase (GH16 family)